jgi:hypothetical protein
MTAFVLICGGALGSLIGELCKNVPYISWLGYSREIGLPVNDPAFLDLIFFKLKLGISFNFSVATIIFIFVALFIYKKVM